MMTPMALKKALYNDKIKFKNSNIESYVRNNFNIAELKFSSINETTITKVFELIK